MAETEVKKTEARQGVETHIARARRGDPRCRACHLVGARTVPVSTWPGPKSLRKNGFPLPRIRRRSGVQRKPMALAQQIVDFPFRLFAVAGRVGLARALKRST